MMYTKEMQVGKKKRRKKHKPSIIQKKDGRCYLCMLLDEDNGVKKTQEHHIFGGPNRDHSEEAGLKVYLCLEHHTAGKFAVHRCKDTRRLLERIAQREFEEDHTREEFMEIFGKNYLDN